MNIEFNVMFTYHFSREDYHEEPHEEPPHHLKRPSSSYGYEYMKGKFIHILLLKQF